MDSDAPADEKPNERRLVIMNEDGDPTENVINLLGTAADAVKMQSKKFYSVFPVQKLRRLFSVSYSSLSNYIVGDHASLVRAMAEILPVEAHGRVCVHYSLLPTTHRHETIHSFSFADIVDLMEEAAGREPGILHRCEYYGCPKVPTVSPSSHVLPKAFQNTAVKSDVTLNEPDRQRFLALENELLSLKEQLLKLTKVRESTNESDINQRGSPPPEPSTSSSFCPPLPPPPPPPPPLPYAPLSIARSARNVNVDSQPSQSTPPASRGPNMKDILKDLSSAKEKLKPVPFSKSPGGTPFRRRRSNGTSSTNRRSSGQHLDHGTMIAEALRKKFAGVNGDQSPHRNSECQDQDDEWDSSFEDTLTETPGEDGDGQKVMVNRMPRRSVLQQLKNGEQGE